jgi:hypothetical protein
MARKPFKKDLTPIGRRGTITTNVGKGATEQRRGPGGAETLTGGNRFASAMNAYPKPMPAPEPEPEPAAPQSMPTMPTAMMPPSGVNEDV